ncbi:MAG TPA: hypothetical protein VGV89_07130 [Thermoplasmata archaeon]|nr:hypothetical protein [Thermoplasmata archaeon]
MDDIKAPPEAPEAPRLRLGKHENWLPLELVQVVIDLLYERERAHLSALLGEAATGEAPKTARPSRARP